MAAEKERRDSTESSHGEEDRGVVTEKLSQPLSDSSTVASVDATTGEKRGAAAGAPTAAAHPHHPKKETRVSADIDHEEAEGAVPGHELDVELAQGHVDDISEVKRTTTRGSAKSKLSKVLSTVSKARSKQEKRERMPFAPIPVSDLAEGIVGWESQDDPEMPLNFPTRKKWLIVGLLSAITLLTPFASSILAPGIENLDKEFGNTNDIIATMTVSIYLLGYVIGPLFLAPLSELYGRRPVLGAANVFFCLWQIGCALAPNISALIVFRFFAGIGGAGCLTLGAGVIADVFRADERGFAIGIYTLGPLLGPTIGPIVGSFVAETIGWRWDFWIVFIVACVITGLTEIFNTETNPRVLMQRKVARLRAELGRPELRSCYEAAGSDQLSRGRILLNGLVRPTKLLFLSPLVFAVSIYIAFAYGTLYLLFTTIPLVFQETYGWNQGVTGLVYISLGLGNMAGWAVITYTSDRTVVARTRANDGVFEPEFRLPLSIYFSFFLPMTFFWYGWSAYYATHWIVPVIGLFPFSFGILGLFLPLTTYLVDCYPMYAASAIAANTVFRSLAGMLLPLAGPSLYQNLGLGWGNSLLGFICVVMIPVPLMLYRFGGKLRKMGLQL